MVCQGGAGPALLGCQHELAGQYGVYDNYWLVLGWFLPSCVLGSQASGLTQESNVNVGTLNIDARQSRVLSLHFEASHWLSRPTATLHALMFSLAKRRDAARHMYM